MARPSKLMHPATLFIQSLDFAEVAFKDMTPLQQQGLYEYMDCEGDGVWADNTNSLYEAIERYGDVRFGVGKFANDATLKEALVEASEEADTEVELDAWFKKHFVCSENDNEQPPVILERGDIAPELGLFQWGYEAFYTYWSHLPETEFIRFLADWDSSDETGRGGQ